MVGIRAVWTMATAGGESPAPAPGTTTGDGAAQLLDASDLLWFGVVALVIFGVVFLVTRLRKPASKKTAAYVTFARLFSLLTVAILATMLAFATVGEEARTAAFAVLGTIAGFLAGAKGTTTSTTQPGAVPGSPTTRITESAL